MEKHLYYFGEFFPKLAEPVFVAPGARIIGRVEIGQYSSVWYNTVIRADIDEVRIGKGTNIQDGCALHEDEGLPLLIGDRVSVGHNTILHGCTIENDAFIGMGAILLSGARIGAGAVVAAGALVTQGQYIPCGHLAMGSPARVIRLLSDEDKEGFGKTAEIYRKRALFCLESGIIHRGLKAE
jgi:carbonic anhydrase/acetyltransferase-like protein (isoleucine patch superfamily)